MRKYFPWLASLLIIVFGFGTIYVAVQQSQRSSANSPQIQMAEDAAAALDKGNNVFGVVYGNVDIEKSLTPFTIVYDKSGKIVTGSGNLDGKAPKVDIGVLKDSKGKDYNAVTWEPKKDVRIAAVSVEAKDYYVLSGRNLSEVEKNEASTMQIALIGGLLSLIVLWSLFIYSNASGDEY